MGGGRPGLSITHLGMGDAGTKERIGTFLMCICMNAAAIHILTYLPSQKKESNFMPGLHYVICSSYRNNTSDPPEVKLLEHVVKELSNVFHANHYLVMQAS